MSAPGQIHREHALRDAVVIWAVVAAAVTGLVQIHTTLPGIGQVGSALVSMIFLCVPMVVGTWRKDDLDDYGFRSEPVKRGLVVAGIAVAIVVPLFAGGYILFYETACHSSLLGHLVPPGMCAKYGGVAAVHAPKVDGSLVEFVGVQFLVVALPEELFFRGMLLGLLEAWFPPKRRFLGGGIGLALVLSSLAFALIHLPKDGDPRALATFFPGLLFGWMRSSTKSILASSVTHASSNILVHMLDLALQR